MDPESGLRLQVLKDQLSTPPGKALVRVIQASLQQHVVTVTWNGQPAVTNLSFGSVSSYQAASPATATLHVSGESETASATITLAAGTVHTIVVLDGAKGLVLDNFLDAAGSGDAPAGGVATGLGGTAPKVPSPMPWVYLIGAGLPAGGGRRARRAAPAAPDCLTMPASRRVALLVLAVGLVAAAAGGAGLALTRHPVASRWGAVPTLPAPTGPIAAATQQRAAPVSPPVALTIPAIGVQTGLVRLGLTASGALQVPASTAVAGWYTGSPRPGGGRLGRHRGAHRLPGRPGVFFRLSSLHPGDRVYVRRADGTLAVFRVTDVRQYRQGRLPHVGRLRPHSGSRAAPHHLRRNLRPAAGLLPEQHGRLRRRDQLTAHRGRLNGGLGDASGSAVAVGLCPASSG